MIINRKRLNIIQRNETFSMFFCTGCFTLYSLKRSCCGKVERTADIRHFERKRNFHVLCNTGFMYDLSDWVDHGILK